MGRRDRLSDERKREIAIASCRRMVARGERPIFHLVVDESPLGFWVSDTTFGTGAWTKRQADAAAAGRQAIAELLEVEEAGFDVVVDR